MVVLNGNTLCNVDKMTSGNMYEITKTEVFTSVFVLLVETTGIEPVTSCMSSKHSNQLSYASETQRQYYITSFFKMQYLF